MASDVVLVKVKAEPAASPASGPVARAAAAAAAAAPPRVKAEPPGGPPRHARLRKLRSLFARVATEVPQFVGVLTELDTVLVRISPSSPDSVPRGLRDARLAARDVASVAVALLVPARRIKPLWDSLGDEVRGSAVCRYLPA